MPPPGDLPHPGIKPLSLASLALVGGFFTMSATLEACEMPCLFRFYQANSYLMPKTLLIHPSSTKSSLPQLSIISEHPHIHRWGYPMDTPTLCLACIYYRVPPDPKRLFFCQHYTVYHFYSWISICYLYTCPSFFETVSLKASPGFCMYGFKSLDRHRQISCEREYEISRFWPHNSLKTSLYLISK